MTRKWVRARDGVYEWRDGAKVLATIERFDPPNNSNFSIWSIVGTQGANFPTLRDAKQSVERRAAQGGL